MLIPVVDANDIQIGLKEREDITSGDIYRVSALWLTNSNGDVLLTQRSYTKKNSPGAWSAAVAGTVECSESYEENILKETQEELGFLLSSSELRLGPKKRMPHLFCQWYFATKNIALNTLILQPDEVIDAQWVTPQDLRRWVSERPEEFTGSMPLVLDEFLAL